MNNSATVGDDVILIPPPIVPPNTKRNIMNLDAESVTVTSEHFPHRRLIHSLVS